MTARSEDPLILNVDDTEAARYAKSRILQRAGFNVIEAASGAEALLRAARDKPSLVLLDTKLPDISGFDVCRQLKEDPHTAMVLVLQTSASYLATPDKVRALDSGADNYLFEPIEPEELVANVRALLRLGRAEQELREVNQRKDEFLAILAHELRNPLGPIRNAVELLRHFSPSAPPAEEKARQMIIRQTDHMVRLVDDLLDVSRISQGKITLRLAPVELGEILRGVVETAKSTVAARRHTLTAQLPSQAVWVAGDGVRLAQIAGNLLNNACKFTPPGGQIHLNAETVGAQALIRVRDNGIGIRPGDIHNIFNLFSQATHADDRVQDGLGIGLSLVKTLVDLHGGSIRVDSAGEGHGSVFEARLPLCAAPAAEPDQADEERRRAAAQPAHRILVVDDNLDAAEIVASLLRYAGHEVTVAHTGGEALDQAAAGVPDVVFLDIGLPGMSGIEVAAEMRRMPQLAATRLVALSGYGQASDRSKSLAAGFDLHLTKPATFEALSDALRAIR
ncbi:ATP-binding response regulator [Pseudoduganella namucuonensis]|uniref:histidine kinase n=1 Tax=Pseudoduganella namucuonensis TaxID=1035707 RepID=A0A1I7HE66_9BURK|nr:response regulator [Pseudoduganella namucuonensis]SFU59024.1 Signal transduction histidine kinase [Pseudoduganella namucuonensis]